jgi:hypothetical protein
MKTGYGPKPRPEFTIVDWRDLSSGLVETKPTPQLPPAHDNQQIGNPVKPTTTAEELNDKVPF